MDDGQSTGDGNAPPIYNNGGFKPPIYNYGGGGSRVPATTTSSASKRCMQPRLLLLLVIVFFFSDGARLILFVHCLLEELSEEMEDLSTGEHVSSYGSRKRPKRLNKPFLELASCY